MPSRRTGARRASRASTIPNPSPRLPPVTTTRSSLSSSPVMDMAHLACDRFERSETGHAFHVRPHVGMLSRRLDVLVAPSLRVGDDASSVLADVNGGRDIAGALAHQGFRALFEDGDERLLILRIHDPSVVSSAGPRPSASTVSILIDERGRRNEPVSQNVASPFTFHDNVVTPGCAPARVSMVCA